METRSGLAGLLAEFPDPEALVAGAKSMFARGYRHLDAHSSFPIEGLAEAIGFERTAMPIIVLISGILGGSGGFFMLYYSAVIDFPMNVGGRPFNSWPAFIPITFELTILAAAFGAFLGMLIANGLPQPYHPLFNIPAFDRASSAGFFLYIEATDPLFDAHGTRDVLKGSGASEVFDVHP